jgi:hypothetical protein
MDKICNAIGYYPDFGFHDYADNFCLLIVKKQHKKILLQTLKNVHLINSKKKYAYI